MTGKEVAILAEKLAKLVDIFRRGGKADDFNWWQGKIRKSLFYPLYGYQDGQPLFEEVVQGVLKLNSEMLSEHEIETKIIFDFLQTQTISWTEAEHLNNQSLVDEAKQHLHKLVEFQTWSDVDIPIANLWLEGEPISLGEVTFITLTQEEIEEWEKQKVFRFDKAPDIRVVARIKAPGDRTKAISYALTKAKLVLEILRAFCFPFGLHSDTWRIGLVEDIISVVSTPLRIDNKRFSTRLGLGPGQIELRKHILSKLKQPDFELINKLAQKSENSRSPMENKLLNGLHLLAESTKPDSNNSKFAKISFALETLIGGEAKDEELKARGITATLAERAAFVAGKVLTDRLNIDRGIRNYYGKRGNIVHGGSGEVSLDDIDKFGELVRRLVLALLEKLDAIGNEISNIAKLEEWIKKQKYTLPNSEEALNAAGENWGDWGERALHHQGAD